VARRLFDTLDGSTEATALLMCLPNGPHVAFFVNGRLELDRASREVADARYLFRGLGGGGGGRDGETTR